MLRPIPFAVKRAPRGPNSGSGRLPPRPISSGIFGCRTDPEPLAEGKAAAAARIETPRLILRQYRPEDFEALRRMSAQQDAFRYSERGPMTAEDAWARLLRHVGHWAVAGYGVYAVENKASGAFVGEVGLCTFARQGLSPDFDGSPEVTWSTVGAMRNRGYATEAARAALCALEASRPTPRTLCLIHQQNRASLRVADKLGFRPFALQTYRGYPAVLLERSR